MSDDDKALWQKTTETVNPLRKETQPPPKQPKRKPSSLSPVEERPVFEPAPFRIGSRSGTSGAMHQTLPTLGQQFDAAPLQMDRKAFQQLKRGKSAPEARLDLHGMTLAQAHPALVRFITGSHASGLRLVLVITGKGKDRDDGGPIPVRFGALRHQVPAWLQQGQLASMVLQVTPAHARHGGHGAYYVYLRRRR